MVQLVEVVLRCTGAATTALVRPVLLAAAIKSRIDDGITKPAEKERSHC